MRRAIWGLLGKRALAALCMQLPFFSAASAAAGCDTLKNHEKWYISQRECGPQGTQLSLLANLSAQEVRGSQVSLLANVATGNVERVQVGGTLNLARSVQSQYLAHVNIAQHVRGTQLGGVNIADTVEGSQIGSLNIANRLDGYSIGLLTLVDDGLLHVDGAVEETGMERLTFASGKGFFTSYSLGYTIGDPGHPYGFGMGFGYHKGFGGLYAEGELDGSVVLDKDTRLKEFGDKDRVPGHSDWRNNLLFQGKLRLGATLLGKLGIFGGITYNALAFDKNDRLIGSWSDDLTATSGGVAWWPGAEVGIRWGR